MSTIKLQDNLNEDSMLVVGGGSQLNKFEQGRRGPHLVVKGAGTARGLCHRRFIYNGRYFHTDLTYKYLMKSFLSRIVSIWDSQLYFLSGYGSAHPLDDIYGVIIGQ